MKRFCPHCGFDQFGHIADGPMRCAECNREIRAAQLEEFSRKPAWWYWLVLPMGLLPAAAGLVAPLLDRLLPGHSLEAGMTFWALALSPLYLYIWGCWIFAAHRMARWYFGAILVSLSLTVANALLIGMMFLGRY